MVLAVRPALREALRAALIAAGRPVGAPATVAEQAGPLPDRVPRGPRTAD